MRINKESSFGIKGNKFKQKRIKYLVSASAMLGILLISMFISISCTKNVKTLIYDYVNGAIALDRVETAQYTPDITNLLSTTNTTQVMSSNLYLSAPTLFHNYTPSTMETYLSDTEFIDVINEYATINNYAGAGKYLGYDIYEIKDEIAFVVETVPAFNQWFRMPTMREEQGFISVPYYESWAYYLEMDEETSKLSITRVCWSTRCKYYDFEKHITVEDNEDGTSFIQYEIMKINYYFNEDGDEVVDCSIYAVGVDNHVSGGTCNENIEDYYPFEYIYLQNVKDKSLIKYHITAAERTIQGMDIRGRYPYGYRREFTLVNYAGYESSNIEMLQIDQYSKRAVNFQLDSNNIMRLINNVGLSQEDHQSSNTAADLLDKICIQIVDNFELKNNWPAIYKESRDAYEIDFVEGPFYGKPIPINDVYVYVSCRDHEKKEIEYSAHADILDMSKFDTAKKYSLSMALRSRDTNSLFIVATDYQYLEEVTYHYPDDYIGEKETYYRLSQANIDIDSSAIKINEPGEYDITCVLTVKENGEDVILFDTLLVAYLRQYYGLEIPNYTDNNGVIYSYAVSTICGKLTITATQVENVNNVQEGF